MKIIGLLIIFSALTYAGFYKASQLFQRIKELDIFISAVEYIRDEIRFLRIPASRIIKKLLSTSRFADYELLKLFSNELNLEKSFYKAWQNTINQYRHTTQLKNDDLIIINSFFEVLGNTDSEGQANICAQTLAGLKRQLQEANEYCKGHSKLYRSIGVLAGIFVCIILM